MRDLECRCLPHLLGELCPGLFELQFFVPRLLYGDDGRWKCGGLHGNNLGHPALLDPTPDAAYPITLAYVARIPALSDANPTNWVLQQAPQMYLYASLLEAEPFLANDARAALWGTAYQVALDGLRAQRWTGNPKLQHEPALSGHGHFDIVTGR